MLLLRAALLLGASAVGADAQFKGNYYGCQDAASKAEKYCDKTLPDKERVDDIVAKLNLTEKIAFGSPTKKPFCACHTAPTAGLPVRARLPAPLALRARRRHRRCRLRLA